jgi:CrcB protein
VENFVLVGLGGFVGANLRYWLSTWIARQWGSAFPWGTLVINFSGSLLLAAFLGWSANRINVDPRLRLLFATGFFGAYTTFSTYANESVALWQSGNWVGALGNVLGTNLACLVGVLLGLALASRL